MMKCDCVLRVCNTFVGPYMIVCIYDICAAGCNQELVQAVVAQVDIAVANVVDNNVAGSIIRNRDNHSCMNDIPITR